MQFLKQRHLSEVELPPDDTTVVALLTSYLDDASSASSERLNEILAEKLAGR